MVTHFTRRTFLGATLAATVTVALASCTTGTVPRAGVDRIKSTDPLVAQYEARRTANGATVTQNLTAGDFDTVVAGTALTTWGYNGTLNGPLIRAKTGDLLKAPVTNTLAEPTSIHWHGLALRNDADGVPGVTQKAIAPGGDYGYQFLLNRPGTYWYHSHVDMQRERALSGALIIDDPNEPMAYDQEWVILLDDWLDGLPGTPDDALNALADGSGMSGMDSGMGGMGSRSTSRYLGGDAGDVPFPAHLFNGQAPQTAEVFDSRVGNRIRLRIINAAGDTAYRVGIPGQKLTLTHTDGFPVQHQEVDAVVLGMGERSDALVTVVDGYTPVLALPEGKDGSAYGLIRTGSGTPPTPDRMPSTLTGDVTDGGQLRADESVRLPSRTPDRRHEMRLTGGMHSYDWSINGRTFNMDDPYAGAFDVSLNERVQITMINDTMMWHPIHLHGHTFQIMGNGARKDTVIVRPGETVTVEFDADNPGQWLVHCHNAYHAARGMIGLVSYVR
ncbi:multicopper oxidase family protein [Cryobacterium sp. 1639]|uniref:multicopper oxidase family protein n=1 Tax=Cryobacterium inferilacus TaxID=2866629 RepID=UPI001C73684E|nr:multicopper oxidase family protein [Cryobacterium sp. 1639]MBX0301890.1 multicopper oxidase family protein [Cryobacterium sp. 1639]